MLTDFHGRANQSFALWEQRISSKAWALSVVPHFSLSPPRVAFSRVGWFHARSRFARSTIPEEKWGTARSLVLHSGQRHCSSTFWSQTIDDSLLKANPHKPKRMTLRLQTYPLKASYKPGPQMLVTHSPELHFLYVWLTCIPDLSNQPRRQFSQGCWRD